MIDSPMAFMIVPVAERLKDDKAKKNHSANHMQRVYQSQRECHAVNFGRTISLAEMMGEQMIHADGLQKHKRD